MSDRISDFIVEAREHLGVVEDSLLALEKSPTADESSSRVDKCFRSIHSIKGDAGFLGLRTIRELSHAMESVLQEIPQPAPSAVIETLLLARDRLAVLVDDTSQSDSIDIRDIVLRLSSTVGAQHSSHIDIDLADWNSRHPGGLVSYFRHVVAGQLVREGRLQVAASDLRASLPTGMVRWTAEITARALSPVPTTPDDTKTPIENSRTQLLTIDLSAWSRSQRGLVGLFDFLGQVASDVSGSLDSASTDLKLGLPGEPVTWSGRCETQLPATELSDRFRTHFPQSSSDAITPFSNSSSRVKPGADTLEPVAEEKRDGMTTEPKPLPISDGGKSTTLRIQVELLDRLMTLVGELTLVRNQSLLAFADEDGMQRTIIQRLNSVTSELQDATLRARMQPVGNVFSKYPRMVRDLARQLGKQVEIELHGREVELDKTILEQLSDPLMHLIRNSVDHGIELPRDRISQGKSPTGRIVLSATHEDGQVHIQIRDDGKGIDPEAVKRKAKSLGLKSEAELDRMSQRELYSLILLPGFSTASQVTEVSGRGVGMDVVKTNIEQMEGTLSIDSAVGLGCSMVLHLPLTLAIIPCLIVTAEGDRFAIPQRDLEEVVCLHPNLSGGIERAYDSEVYRLRDKLLPIVRLSDVLSRHLPFSNQDKSEILAGHPRRSRSEQISYILVLRQAGRRFGLVIDEVRGTQEIVVKPMHASMKRVGIFTGATIMGDGRVALIIDTEGVVQHARLSFESAMETPVKSGSVRDAAQAHRVLLFEYGPNERFALPLLQIRRIEMVSQQRIELMGDHEFVTVDGVSTRIMRLNKVVNVSAQESDAAMMPLILPKFVPQPIGILASRIVDTESLALELQQHPDQDQGILGSAIVRDRLTLFLDMHRLSEKLFGLVPSTRQTPAQASLRPKRILLIDDTAFFREVVKRYLNAEGHEVATAIHGEEALARLAVDSEFDLIVSDIEMPVMDGWEFAREARRRGIRLPMLALTSLSGSNYEQKARECGFDNYEVKLDHDRLVRKIGNLLSAGAVAR